MITFSAPQLQDKLRESERKVATTTAEITRIKNELRPVEVSGRKGRREISGDEGEGGKLIYGILRTASVQ